MKRTGYMTALLVGGLLTAGSLGAQQPAQEDRPVFKAGVDLVTLQVSVLDSYDLPVEGLTAADFIVFEDGVEQDVAMLLSPRETPLDIALLMDVSESMGGMNDAAKVSALQFLNQLADNDCVLLLRFTGIPGPGIWGRPDDQGIWKAINDTPAEGGSAVRDAIAVGFHRLEHDSDRCGPETYSGARNDGAPQRRPALVVVTDGVDRHSDVNFEDLLSLARQTGAPFFPVGFGNIVHPAFVRSLFGRVSNSRLEGLARVTGGQFIIGGKDLEKLSAAYGNVIRWLRSYYLVGYYPSPTTASQVGSELPSWHEVEVRLRQAGYRAHTRNGYYRSPISVNVARRHVQTGIDLSARQETARALVEFGYALQADPHSWEAHYHRGRALMLTGQTREAQQALLSAARLGPGRGHVHKLACGVSFELEDYETAWDQAIRAQQAEINMTNELLLLRQQTDAPANLEERLSAPRIHIDYYWVFDLVEETALRRVSLVLAQELSNEPEIGLIDLEALADYRLFIKLKKLADESPRKLEADLELWESADNVDIRGPAGPLEKRLQGKRLHRKRITLTNVENPDSIAAELAPYIADLRSRLAELR
jgi:VWFA-related protein